MKKINEFKYPAEGEIRRGHHAPFVSVVIPFDVRIKKEYAGRFLRDIQAGTAEDFFLKPRGGSGYPGRKAIGWVLRFVRWFTPLKKVERAEGEREFSIRPWLYTFCLGGVKDPEQKVFMRDKKREIL